MTIFVHMTILIQRSLSSKFQIYISLSQCHCSPQVSVDVEPPGDESQAANVHVFSHRNESPMAGVDRGQPLDELQTAGTMWRSPVMSLQCRTMIAPSLR